MASVSSPYGLKPIGLIGNRPGNGITFREYPVTSNNTVAIYTNGLVNITAGTANGVGTAPAAGTLSANSPIGVCVGVRYTDPTLKQTQYAQYLPANAITAGYTNIFVRVVDDPDALFQIQSTTQVPTTAVGLNVNITTLTGSATTGLSAITCGAAATTATFPLRIVDLVNSGFSVGYPSTPNDLFTDVIVKWNWTTHAYSFTTGQ